jgi:tetratricopeptide (TPR) repeat protein
MGELIPHEMSGGNAASADSTASWEIGFYEDILKRNPDYVEVLMLLGNLYTGRKMYREGLRVDQRLARLRQDDPIVHYNLACSHALMNQADAAFAALFEAIELGYHDLEHMEEDSDLDLIRMDPRYDEATARIQAHRS